MMKNNSKYRLFLFFLCTLGAIDSCAMQKVVLYKKLYKNKWPASFTLCMSNFFTTQSRNSSEKYKFKIIEKNELIPFRSFVSEQRIKIFRDYPYLDGNDPKEEYAYFDWISSLPCSTLTVACYENEPVAFTLGTSLVQFNEHFKVSLFENVGLNPQEFYYIADSIVLPEHRKNGLCKKLMQIIEMYAWQHGFTKTCLACEEHETHPLKPKDYKALSKIWLANGYKSSALSFDFDWMTIQVDGTVMMQKHTLHYWIKNIKAASLS